MPEPILFNDLLLIPLAVLLVIFAGLFAGAETGTYQLSLLRLRLGAEHKRFLFITLARVLRDRRGLLISILIGTNLSYYLTTSIMTFILMNRFANEHTVELITVAVITPTLFVFSELLPKSIFFYRADRLMPLVAPVLFLFNRICTFVGIVGVLKKISGFFSRLGGSAVPTRRAGSAIGSSYIKALFEETQEEDVLSSVQRDIINRVADISELKVKAVMTLLNKVEMIERNADELDLFKKLKICPFTRLPVYRHTRSNIIGYINIYDVLCSSEQFTDLQMFVKPIRKLDADTNVADAMNIMQKEKQKILLVTRGGLHGKERSIGIVTMKDLVEELLGELTEW